MPCQRTSGRTQPFSRATADLSWQTIRDPRERRKAYWHAYYEKNRRRLIRRAAEYARTHREQQRAWGRAWSQAHLAERRHRYQEQSPHVSRAELLLCRQDPSKALTIAPGFIICPICGAKRRKLGFGMHLAAVHKMSTAQYNKLSWGSGTNPRCTERGCAWPAELPGGLCHWHTAMQADPGAFETKRVLWHKVV